MIEILANYFYVFLHPFEAHRRLAQGTSSAQISVAASGEAALDAKWRGAGEISFEEGLLVSWFFSIFRAFYGLASMNMGVYFFNLLSAREGWEQMFLSQINFSAQKVMIFWTLMDVVLFPVWTWLYAQVMQILIKFFSRLYEYEGNVEEASRDVVTYSLVSNTFLVVPIFGNLLRNMSALVYVYAGLKERMGLNNLQSSLVLVSPIFIVLGLFLTTFISFVVTFGLI